ncbi:MAG: winged helix-turn-helix domain-containing protein [Terracidiphilus sp.]
MKGLQTKPTQFVSSRPRRSQRRNLLLVGSEDALKSQVGELLLDGMRLQCVARASDLSEAFVCLESGTIDLLLLSSEFREKELNLFAHDARFRGFTGLILHVADAPGNLLNEEPPETNAIRIGDFVIDVLNRQSWVRGVEMACSPKEFDLLTFFCRHPEEVLSYGTLLGKLWGTPIASVNALKVLIRNLRAKVETTTFPQYIAKERQLGYRFHPSPRTPPRSQVAN